MGLPWRPGVSSGNNQRSGENERPPRPCSNPNTAGDREHLRALRSGNWILPHLGNFARTEKLPQSRLPRDWGSWRRRERVALLTIELTCERKRDPSRDAESTIAALGSECSRPW